jgi:hypothetical protein
MGSPLRSTRSRERRGSMTSTRPSAVSR